MVFKSIIGSTCACLAVVTFSAPRILWVWNVLTGEAKKKFSALTLCGAFMLMISGTASASPVLWTFNVDFGGGDTGLSTTGSFVYDADINSYSSISFVTDAGTISGAAYGFVTSSPSSTVLDFISTSNPDPTGALRFQFGLNGPMMNAGGVLGIAGGAEWVCLTSACDFPGWGPDMARGFAGHSNISSVPVPAAVWLFGSGLVGLIGVARRKKA